MSASEVGVGYVRLLPSMRGFSAEVRREMAPIGRQAGTGFGGSFSRGFVASAAGIVDSIGRTVLAGVETVGTVAGGILATSITGGIRRLMGLEDAASMLDQLGVGAKDQRKLMDSLLDSLLGTPFALDAGASAMTNFVSSGRDLDEIPRLMNQVVDAAGFGKAPLNEIGEIWNRIGMTGRVTNRELQMLTMRNIPAYTLLASAIGVTEEAIFDMASSGELSADMFFDAWEQGAKGFGANNVVMEGAAKSMGDTTRGAFSNMLTAASRFGANLAGPIFGDAKTFFTGITAGFDELGARVGPVMERLADSPGFRRFRRWLVDLPDMVGPAIDWVVDKFKELGPAAAPLAAAFGAISLGGLARALGPLGALVPVISPLAAAFAGLVASSPELREAFRDLWTAAEPLVIALGETLLQALVGLAESAIPVLVTIIEGVLIPTLDFLGEHAAIAVPALLGIAGALWAISLAAAINPFTWIVVGILAIVGATILLVQNWDEYLEYLGWLWDGFVDIVGRGVTPIVQAFGSIYDGFVQFRNRIGAALSALPAVIKAAISSIPGIVGDMLGRLTDAVTGGIADFWYRSLNTMRAFEIWVGSLPARIVGSLARLGGMLKTTATEAWNQWWAGAVASFRTMMTWIRGLPGAIRVALNTLGPILYRTALQAFRQLLVGARERAYDMILWVRNIPDRIVRALGNLGRILYNAGRQIINGLRDGLRDAWDDVSKWLATRAWEIKHLKGPLSEDRRLLALEGQAIIGGLFDSMANEWAAQRHLLSDMAGAVQVELAPVAARGAAGAATSSPVTTGGLSIDTVNVGDRDDYDELSVRMASMWNTYGG